MSPKDVRIEDLVAFCDSMARNVMKDHEKRFADKAKGLREASVGLGNAASKFASGVKNAWGTLDKSVSEYGMRLAHVIQENAQALSEKDTGFSYRDAERLHDDAVATLNRIIVTVRKYVPKLHKALRSEMATLNYALLKLENSVKALGAALDESPGLKLEELQREIRVIMEKHDQLLKLRSELQHEDGVMNGVSERQTELLAKKQALTSLPEFLELKRYEDALETKEGEIRQFLQPITKPLLKLERTISEKQGSRIDLRTLHNLIENPVEALVTGQTYAFTELLSALQEALADGQLEIEERKRRKAEETVKAARDNAIQKMRDDFLALQANTQETLRQLKTKGLLEKRDELDNLFAETQSQRGLSSSRSKELQRRIDELSGNILKEKTSIESRIYKIAKQSISINAD